METRICASPACHRSFRCLPSQRLRYCSIGCASRTKPRPPPTLYAPDMDKRDRLFLHAERRLPSDLDLTPPIPRYWLTVWAEHCRFPLRRAEELQLHPAWGRMLKKRAARLAGKPLCTETQRASARDPNERCHHHAEYRKAIKMLGLPFAHESRIVPRPNYPGRGTKKARRRQGLPGLPQPGEEPSAVERLLPRTVSDTRTRIQCEATPLILTIRKSSRLSLLKDSDKSNK